jgi:phosphoenolpyruvate carboxykinase (ATP)
MRAIRVTRVRGGFFVQETGLRNGAFGADKFGLKNLKTVHWNLGAPQLYQYSLAAGEAVLSADGALCADTGEFTGRSPKDKFTVRDATTDKNMWWAGNQSITSDQFSALYADFLKHAEGMTLFAQDLYGGADPSFQIKTRVFTELAWHSLFIRTLLIRPEASALRASCRSSPSSTCRASAPIPNVTAAARRTSSRSISPARSS